MSIASLRSLLHRSRTPRPAVSDHTSWVTSAALAASGAFTASSIIEVRDARRLTLWLKYDADASATAGYCQVLPVVCGENTQPTAIADDWFGMGTNDGSLVATALTGTIPAGTDITGDPEFASVTMRGLVLRTEASNNGTDKIRMRIPLDIEDCKWCYLLYAEEGDTTNPGVIEIDYTLST